MRLRPTRTLTAALTAGLMLTSSGCASDTSSDGDGESVNAADHAETLGHVHGLGVDPADDTLYIASHMGVFQRTDDGQLTRVADRWQDTMGLYPPPAELISHRMRMNTFLGKWLEYLAERGHGVATLRRDPDGADAPVERRLSLVR